MNRLVLFFVAATLATPVVAAETKAKSCEYQAMVVSAIQQARLDRVAERGVPAHIEASSPEWPENFNAMIPLATPWVYEQKRRDIRNKDLGAAWSELCLQQ